MATVTTVKSAAELQTLLGGTASVTIHRSEKELEDALNAASDIKDVIPAEGFYYLVTGVYPIDPFIISKGGYLMVIDDTGVTSAGTQKGFY